VFGLQYEFTMRAVLGSTQVVGRVAAGVRMVVPVTGGWVRGERLSGEIVPPGADWAIVGDGWARVDVREQLRTDDGATIYVAYEGLLEVNDKVLGALADPALETGWDDQYFRVTPRLEAAAEQYDWVNYTVFVARGRIAPDGVEYEVSCVL
jgi:hypothetical protein